MTNPIYRRMRDLLIEKKMTWNELCAEAHVPMGSWCFGVPYDQPSDDELRRIAPVLDTTYEWLRYGQKAE